MVRGAEGTLRGSGGRSWGHAGGTVRRCAGGRALPGSDAGGTLGLTTAGTRRAAEGALPGGVARMRRHPGRGAGGRASAGSRAGRTLGAGSAVGGVRRRDRAEAERHFRGCLGGAPGRRGVEGRSAGRGGAPPEAAGPALPELREAPVAGCRPEFSGLGDMPVDGRRPRLSALGDVPVDGRRPRLSEFGDTPAAGPRAVFSAFGVAPGPGRPASGGVSGKRAEARGGVGRCRSRVTGCGRSGRWVSGSRSGRERVRRPWGPGSRRHRPAPIPPFACPRRRPCPRPSDRR